MSGLRDLLLQTGRGGDAAPGRCLDAERLIAFYGGELDGPEAEAVREHLAACPACLELAQDARTFLQAMGDAAIKAPQGAPPQRAGLARAQRWVAAAALIVVAGGGAWGWWRHARDSAWQEFPIARADYPLPVPDEPGIVWRGEEEPANAFAQAIDPYLHGDYAGAEQQLAAYLRQHPRHPEADLYRGVSLLLLGRPQAAIAPLAEAAGSGQEPTASEARWYLAQAYLKTGDRRAAGHELQRLAAGAGRRSVDARELLQRIGAD